MALGDMAVLDAALVEVHGSSELPDAAADNVPDTATAGEQTNTTTNTDGQDSSAHDGETAGAGEGEQELDLADGDDEGLEKPPVVAKTAEELAAEKATQTAKEKPEIDPAEAEADTSIKALQGFATKDPAFQKVLDANPALKATLYGAARLASRATKYDGMFQSPQLAQHLKIAGEEFIQMDELFNGDDPAEFVKFLISNSLEYDEAGKPISENGRYKTSGAYERVAQYWQGQWMNDVQKHASALKNMQHDVAQADGEELEEALKVINRVIFKNPDGNGPAKKAQDDDLAGLPEHHRREILEARARNAKPSNGEQDKEFTSSVDTGVDKMAREYAEGLVNNLLARNPKIVLGEFTKKHLIAEAIEKAQAAAKTNSAHSSTFKHMLKSVPRNQQGIDALVNTKKAFFREVIPGVIRELFKESTTSTLAAAKERGKKISTQVDRKEPPTTGRVKTPSGPGGGNDFHQVLAAAAQAKGKPLTQMEIMDLALQ